MDDQNEVLEDEQVLGGDIRLVGFSVLDSDEMLVVKKIVGRYVREFSEGVDEYHGIDVYLTEDDDFKVEIDLEFDEELVSVSSENENVFVCLDDALKELKNDVLE